MDKNSTETGTPIVSIIVPVYNVEKYIRQCLDSIVAQTFTDFEAVLVDDGSTDSSGDICDEYAQKDPHFTAVHKQNEGVAPILPCALRNTIRARLP
jgi:glycosyltransferase involved in cell wall biosynthesis